MKEGFFLGRCLNFREGVVVFFLQFLLGLEYFLGRLLIFLREALQMFLYKGLIQSLGQEVQNLTSLTLAEGR